MIIRALFCKNKFGSPVGKSNHKIRMRFNFHKITTDPGFRLGGGADPPGGQHTILPKFPKKINLHEIEKVLCCRGAPVAPP